MTENEVVTPAVETPDDLCSHGRQPTSCPDCARTLLDRTARLLEDHLSAYIGALEDADVASAIRALSTKDRIHFFPLLGMPGMRRVIPLAVQHAAARLRAADPDTQRHACAHLVFPVVMSVLDAMEARDRNAAPSTFWDPLFHKWSPNVLALTLASMLVRHQELRSQILSLMAQDERSWPRLLHEGRGAILDACQLLPSPVPEPKDERISQIGDFEDGLDSPESDAVEAADGRLADVEAAFAAADLAVARLHEAIASGQLPDVDDLGVVALTRDVFENAREFVRDNLRVRNHPTQIASSLAALQAAVALVSTDDRRTRLSQLLRLRCPEDFAELQSAATQTIKDLLLPNPWNDENEADVAGLLTLIDLINAVAGGVSARNIIELEVRARSELPERLHTLIALGLGGLLKMTDAPSLAESDVGTRERGLDAPAALDQAPELGEPPSNGRNVTDLGVTEAVYSEEFERSICG